MSDLDDEFASLLREVRGGEAGAVKKPKAGPATYNFDYTWKPIGLVFLVHKTTCQLCGNHDFSAGGLFLESTARVADAKTMIRKGREELRAFSHLPKRTEVRSTSIEACYHCSTAVLNFPGAYCGPTQTSRPDDRIENLDPRESLHPLGPPST